MERKNKCRNCKWFMPTMITYDKHYRKYYCAKSLAKVYDPVTDLYFARLTQCSEVLSHGECPDYEEGELMFFPDWAKEKQDGTL